MPEKPIKFDVNFSERNKLPPDEHDWQEHEAKLMVGELCLMTCKVFVCAACHKYEPLDPKFIHSTERECPKRGKTAEG